MSTRRGKLQFLFLILFIFPLAAQVSSVTSEGYLRDWQNDGDHVAYSGENGNVTSVMTADEEKLVLRKYDDRHRLISETVWENGYVTITSETVWTYPEKGVYPLSMNKALPQQEQLVKVLYSAAGSETERSVWKTAADGTADVLLEKTAWQYDGQNRVIEKLFESYRTDKDGVAAKTVQRSEKTEYTYTDKSSDPDMLYYENGMLVEKIERISDGCYVDSLFFDDMEIKTTWEDGVKTDEVYYLEGKELKRKSL